MRHFPRWVAVTSLFLGAWAAPLPVGAMPALGHTYTVNSTLDEPDDDPSNGICSSTPSGLCTLRAAIMESNFATGPNTILLPAGTYTLTRPGFDNAALVGDLDIGHDISIQGAGSGATILDGNGAVTGDRVFEVLDTVQTVSLSGMTIRNGHAANGGGIYSNFDGDGHLSLTDVILEGNTADGDAGGLFAYDGHLTLSNSTLRDNVAGKNGGGLYGLYGYPDLVNSTLSDNVAGAGGGLYVFHAQTTLLNSTFSGNVSAVAGGGVYIDAGSVQLMNATLDNNQVRYQSAIQSALGGGVYLTHTASLTARNSIIAHNTRNNHRVGLEADDCSSVDSTGGLYYSLFTTLANCTIIIGGQIGNIVGQDPLLGPLQDNGGATQTQALLAASPAIDAGDPAGCSDGLGGMLSKDQRGAPRSDARCDLGAYEVVPAADLGVGLRANTDPARPGLPLTYTVALTNTGPAAATDIELVDTPPLSATIGPAVPSQGVCLHGVTISCLLGTLASGAHVTVTLMITPTVSGILVNYATAVANEFDPAVANNTAIETTTVTTAAVRELFLPVVLRGP